jgi:hypothetical protein
MDWKMEMLMNFNAAGVGGFISTTATYPIDIVKNRLQAAGATTDERSGV